MNNKIEKMRKIYEEQLAEVFNAVSKATDYEYVDVYGETHKEPVGHYNGSITNALAKELINIALLVNTEGQPSDKPVVVKTETKKLISFANKVVELNDALLERELLRGKEIKMSPFPYEELINILIDLRECKKEYVRNKSVLQALTDLIMRVCKMLHYAYGQDGMKKISEIRYAIDTGVYSSEQYAISPEELETEKEPLLTMLRMEEILLRTLQKMPLDNENRNQSVLKKLLDFIDAIDCTVQVVMQGKSKELDKLYKGFCKETDK